MQVDGFTSNDLQSKAVQQRIKELSEWQADTAMQMQMCINVGFLCRSMLKEDLMISSSEDSDGEQEAKNASRNTSAR